MSHGRSASAMSTTNSFRNGVLPGLNGSSASIPIPEHPPILSFTASTPRDREPSPTLPSLPSHPTLNSLISSTLGSPDLSDGPPSDPAILAIGGNFENVGTAPRIGDPGKRMLGAALGVRHPGLAPRVISQKQSSSNGPSPVAVTAE